VRITLIENFRAVFYTPFYTALTLRAFADEGIDVELRTSPDPAKTLQQLGADTVSWGGPMRLLFNHDRDPASQNVAFCEAIGRDPFFLVGATPNAGYRPSDLHGKRIAVVSEVPTPWICLQQDLRLAGIDPKSLHLAPPRTMAQNADRLRRGELDVIQVFQPFAQQLMDEGCGHRWYAAATRGLSTYTTLNTTRGFIERNPATVLGMTRAMYRTLQWLRAHDGSTIASRLAPWFPDLPHATLAACLGTYQSLGLWNATPVMQSAGFDWLRDAMQASGDIARRIPFEECVDMRYAEQVVREGVAPLAG
jgi:NitT/TauT family transport system substrate-binding protein